MIIVGILLAALAGFRNSAYNPHVPRSLNVMQKIFDAVLWGFIFYIAVSVT